MCHEICNNVCKHVAMETTVIDVHSNKVLLELSKAQYIFRWKLCEDLSNCIKFMLEYVEDLTKYCKCVAIETTLVNIDSSNVHL